MKKTCINCKYVGAVTSKEGLVCSLTKNFEGVLSSQTCFSFVLDKETCTCGSRDVSINSFSPEDKPYVVRTEYDCQQCKAYWYEED